MRLGKWFQRNWRKIRNILLIVLLFVAIAAPCILVLQFRTEARLALREAKNVKLYLRTLDVEAYGNGRTIYDGTKADGLSGGVYDSVVKYLDHDCELKLTSYNKINREVTGFIYTRNGYQVVYTCDKEEGDTWRIYYIMELMHYE